jgi:DNA repair protein RecO
MKQQDNGFILKIIPVKDHDSIITILTKNSGSKDFYVKNIRRTQSKRRTYIEILNLINFTYSVSKSSSQLDYLGEIKLNNTFESIKSQKHFFAESFLLAETIYNLTKEQDENGYVFDLLFNAAMTKTTQEKSLNIFNFLVLKILNCFGFIPKLNFCIKTNQKFQKHDGIELITNSPGYYKSKNKKSYDLIRIIKIQNYIINKTTNFSKYINLDIKDKDLLKLTEIHIAWIEYVIEKELKSKHLLKHL